jgi:hypothetical protein
MFKGGIQQLVVSIAIAIVVVGLLGGIVLYFFGGTLLGSGITSAVPEPTQGPPQFPRMTLQAQYAGPLVGTIIQRWRDPVDGTTCYIYLPIVAKHTPAPSGYVEYGSNAIGSISCMPGTAAPAQP